ncbi:hypothetical protein [Streptomyces sp. NPDC058066]
MDLQVEDDRGEFGALGSVRFAVGRAAGYGHVALLECASKMNMLHL